MNARHLSAVVITAACFLAACGGAADAPSGPGGSPLTVEEALAAGSGPVAVRGTIVAPDGGDVELCSALLESYPPQCGRPSLVVVGLDLASLAGIVHTAEPDLAQVSWSQSEVTVPGTLEGGVLTVAAG